jgi:7-cyano-7-deazaguanosine (preQ0) biosynthesis protein QueE
MQLAVNEIFGPTVQGEGRSLGSRAVFLRLAMCNLKCSWCDTKYTWDWKGEFGPAYSRASEVHLMDVASVWDEVEQAVGMDTDLVVVTGGEPLLQSRALREGFNRYGLLGSRVEIETNGTISPLWLPWERIFSEGQLRYNVSPKLASSGNGDKRLNEDAIEEFVLLERSDEAIFKFVVTSRADFSEVDEFVEHFLIGKGSVYIMPEGTDAQTLRYRTADLADEAVSRGYNLTTRLHVLAWGNERGR